MKVNLTLEKDGSTITIHSESKESFVEALKELAVSFKCFDVKNEPENKRSEKSVVGIPSFLRKYRTDKFLTKSDMARFFEVNKQTYANWESGANTPTGERAQKVMNLMKSSGVLT